jgi:hypothetical protein
MRKLILLGALLALVAGCKKPSVKVATNNPPAPQPVQPLPQPNQPNVHAPTGVVTNPNQGGGSGGAAQAVRKAAKRAANQSDLSQLRLFIEGMIVDERMPTREQIAAALSKDAPNLYKLWTDGVIDVTGTRRTDGIWAYTVEDQSTAGYHLIVTRSGSVERITPQDLKQRLKEQ